MKKEWRVPFALVTADVIWLALSFVVLIVLFESAVSLGKLWEDVFFYSAFILSGAWIVAWVVVSWQHIRQPGDREKLITHPKELALASIGIIFGATWLATAGALLPVMSGLVISYVFMGLVLSPWVIVACIVWFWYSI